MAVGPRLFENISGYRLAFHPNGHKSRVPGACFDTVWLHTTSSELGLCLPDQEVLGRRQPGTFVHAGHIKYHHRCRIHGCADHLPVTDTIVEENAAGYSNRVSAHYTVSQP